MFLELDVARAVDARPTVWKAHPDAPDSLSVHVLQRREPLAIGGPPGFPGVAIYRFYRHLRLHSAEFVERYRHLSLLPAPEPTSARILNPVAR